MQEVAWIALPVVLFVLGMPIYLSVSEYRQGRIAQVRVVRWWIMCTFMFFFSLLSGLVFGFAGAWISRLPVKPARDLLPCKVVSKDVDLRWAKICGLGDLSPISLRLFGIPDRSKFRCSLDYYWVSTLKLEFRPYHSGVPVQAVAELPAEVLPAGCRPGFAAVWKATERFEVNSTLSCLYPGKAQALDVVDFPPDGCIPDSPSSLKLLRDYLFIVFSSYKVKQSTSTGNLFWRGIYAAVASLAVSIVITAITKALSWFHFKVFDPGNSAFINVVLFEARFQISILVCAMGLGLVLLTSELEELHSGVQVIKRDLQLSNWLQKLFV